MKFRHSVQFPLKRNPIIIYFEHFQVSRIFEKPGISVKIGLFSIFFFVSTPLLYAEFNEIGRFRQKCIILFFAEFQSLKAPLYSLIYT